MDLTDAQWEVIEALLPKPTKRKDERGRPYRDPRDVLNGILWVLRTGAPWADLPARYPSYQTCHRRFQQWEETGALDTVLRGLARDLKDRGKLDLTETFIDGSFSGAKKGGLKSEKPSVGRGPRSWQWSTAMAFLSPSGSKALRPTKSLSSKKP